MMNIPKELKYTEEHEWARAEGDTVTVGITDYAQGELGDVVYVELPSVGDTFGQNDVFGSIEAVKAASDLYCPLSGEVVEVNENLGDSPETINKDPYGDGWMIKIKISASDELNALLDAEGYQAHIGD
jgi:glycine cleavage system H protein